MPPEASAGVPKGTYRKYVPEGIQVPLRARASKSEQWSFAAFQKLQFLESFLDLHYAMFKIKSLRYKDLILNSIGCRKSNRLLRQPAHYRIFALQKYAAVLQRYDTASLPCVEGRSPRNLQRARSAKFPAQEFSSVSDKRKTLSGVF